VSQAARPPEPVAIVGMTCRFPGGVNLLADFWKLLAAARDAVGELPAGRWDEYAATSADHAAALRATTRTGGLREDIDGFDAALFGLSPREAALMDPQQRMVLELSWEALEHAGTIPASWPAPTPGSLWASALMTMAACSASLVAVHLACQSLRTGETPVAMAGGVMLMVGPGLTAVMNAAGALSPSGRCRSFDARADGYIRGEGGGVLVLKLLSDARRDGDRVLALISGSAVSQDGRTDGIMAPSRQAQEHLPAPAGPLNGQGRAAPAAHDHFGTAIQQPEKG
jgi:6-methylsalicylic acid synthase